MQRTQNQRRLDFHMGNRLQEEVTFWNSDLCIQVTYGTLKRGAEAQFSKNRFFHSSYISTLQCSCRSQLSDSKKGNWGFQWKCEQYDSFIRMPPLSGGRQCSVCCLSSQASQANACEVLDLQTVGKPEDSRLWIFLVPPVIFALMFTKWPNFFLKVASHKCTVKF